MKTLLIAMCTFCVTATTLAGYELTFLSSDHWNFYFKSWSGVQLHDNELRFMNGATIVSREEAPPKCQIKFKWAWEEILLKTKNRTDCVTVAIRTTGEVDNTGRPTNGLLATIDAESNLLTIEQITGGKAEVLSTQQLPDRIPPVGWHEIIVSDSGTAVSVSINGKAAMQKYNGRKLKGRRIAFQNRRTDNSNPTASYIRELEVKALD